MEGIDIWGEHTQACLCWIAVFKLYPVFQAVIACVHAIRAVGRIGDVHSPVLFERELDLLSLKMLWVHLNFALVEADRLAVVGHEVGHLWWGSKAAGKVGIQGTQSGGNTILECH